MATGTPRPFPNAIPKATHANAAFAATVTVPGNMVLNGIVFTLDSTNAGIIQFSDPATSIRIQSEFSLDGGNTWRLDFDQTIAGGYRDHQGNPADPVWESNFTPSLPAGAKVRATLTVTGSVFFGLGVTFYTTP